MSEKTRDFVGTTLPDFKGAKVFILPGAFYGAVVAYCAEAGMSKATSVEDADIIAFIGGADIDPALYGEKNVKAYGVNKARDELEVEVYNRAQELGKVCFGICRGAQFLHAMNGGKLWQNVSGHGGRDHWVVDLDDDVRFLATSIHHQALQENDTMDLIAVCEEPVATEFEDADIHVKLRPGETSNILEVEAGAYEKTKCFFVQGHPEVGSPTYRAWTMTRLHERYLDWAGKLRSVQDVLQKIS